VLFLGLAAAIARSAEVPEYGVKAELLARFPAFIEWPAGNDTRPFTIGVAGHSAIDPYLDRLAARRIKGRSVVIREITELPQVDGCDLLFIAASERSRLAAILARTASRPILTVGDSSGYAAAGVLINFYTAGDTVHFEINESAVERSGLRVSSKLFKLARIVEPEVPR
jgi:YfiR/HmsC-like